MEFNQNNEAGMEYLIRFSPALLHNVLVDWLQLQHVCRLDAAFCAREYRVAFLHCAYCDRNIYNSTACYEAISLHHRRSDEETKGLVKWATNRGTFLNAIAVTSRMEQDDQYRERVLTAISNHITTIEFSCTENPNGKWKETLNAVCYHFPNIMATVCSSKFNTAAYMQIYQNWPQLQDLSLSYIISESDFMLIGKHCKNLKTLCVRANEVSRKGWDMCLKGCGANLVVLQGLQVTEHSTSNALRSIARYCPNLCELYVDENIEISDLQDRWEEVVEGCPHLHTVFYRARSGEQALLALAQLGAQLQYVDLTAKSCMAEYALIDLVEACTNLRRLTLADQDYTLWNATFVAIAQCCPHLEDLGVHWLSPWQVTDTAAFALAGSCRKLTYLALPGSGVTDAGLIALMAANPGLVNLDMEGCKGITDASMRAVPLLCPHMYRLNVFQTSVKADGVHAILQGCRLLRCFSVPAHQQKMAKEAAAGPYGHIFRPGLTIHGSASLWCFS